MQSAKHEIRDKVLDLARRRGVKARELRDDEQIPEAGLLDSAAIVELVVWFEQHFGVEVDQTELTIENFGTVDSMANYLQRSR